MDSKTNGLNSKPILNGVSKIQSVVRRFRWIFTVLALALIGLAIPLLQPLPTELPRPRTGSALGLVQIPGIGPAWVEMGVSIPVRGRSVLRVHALHPEIRIHPEFGQVRWWSAQRVHPANPDSDSVVARLEWDGHSFNLQSGDGNTNSIRLVPRVVTGMVEIASKSGFQIRDRGVAVEWSSHRPRWAEPTALDEKVERDSVRMEKESWDEFFAGVRLIFGNRLGLAIFDSEALSGIWPCERWKVIYHRSESAISVLHVCYRNVGGVHGNTHISHSNFIDGPAGVEWLDFATLFQHPFGWQDEVRRLLLEDLRRQEASWAQEAGPPLEVEEIQGPTLRFSEDELANLKFTLSSEGVFVHFEEYEAGTYAEGNYVVLLPWKALSPWVRRDIIAAFKIDPSLPGIPIDQGEPKSRSRNPRSLEGETMAIR
ncbi:MAG: hypothetical protein RIS24_1526 [Verrucomicrobiota bacterium]